MVAIFNRDTGERVELTAEQFIARLADPSADWHVWRVLHQ